MCVCFVFGRGSTQMLGFPLDFPLKPQTRGTNSKKDTGLRVDHLKLSFHKAPIVHFNWQGIKIDPVNHGIGLVYLHGFWSTLCQVPANSRGFGDCWFGHLNLLSFPQTINPNH